VLTKCYECGHEVSTEAAVCPNCGAPTKQNTLPPIPTSEVASSSAPTPIRPPALRTSRVPQKGGDQKVLRFLVVPGLGLLGAWFGLYVGSAIFTGLGSIRSDYSQFASEYPLLAPIVAAYLQHEGTDVAVGELQTGALILVTCGAVGALASILFFAHRYSKVLSVVLILCGVGPLFYRGWEFFSLPMALGGVLGLMVHDKTKATQSRDCHPEHAKSP
jgi:hypothetical protein